MNMRLSYRLRTLATESDDDSVDELEDDEEFDEDDDDYRDDDFIEDTGTQITDAPPLDIL